MDGQLEVLFIALAAFPCPELGRKHFLAVALTYGSGGRKLVGSFEKFIPGTSD